MSESQSDYNLEMSTGRLETFTDGVFAIAITLLIIEVKVPSHEDLEKQSLMQYIYHQWPKYFAYVFSFINIGIYWANHHYLFKLFRRTDHYFNLLNLFFLMGIAFFPYPAGILGEYIMEEEHRKAAIIFYTFSIWMPAVGWFLMWTYARHKKRIIDHRLTDKFIYKLNRLFIVSNLLYLFSFLLSTVNAIASISLSIALTFVYILPPKKPEYN
jgi:uncharacterized membrane protein